MVNIPERVLQDIVTDISLVRDYLATLPNNVDNRTAVQTLTDRIEELKGYTEE